MTDPENFLLIGMNSLNLGSQSWHSVRRRFVDVLNKLDPKKRFKYVYDADDGWDESVAFLLHGEGHSIIRAAMKAGSTGKLRQKELCIISDREVCAFCVNKGRLNTGLTFLSKLLKIKIRVKSSRGFQDSALANVTEVILENGSMKIVK